MKVHNTVACVSATLTCVPLWVSRSALLLRLRDVYRLELSLEVAYDRGISKGSNEVTEQTHAASQPNFFLMMR